MTARLHRPAKSIPWNRFLGPFFVYKFGLSSVLFSGVLGESSLFISRTARRTIAIQYRCENFDTARYKWVFQHNYFIRHTETGVDPAWAVQDLSPNGTSTDLAWNSHFSLPLFPLVNQCMSTVIDEKPKRGCKTTAAKCVQNQNFYRKLFGSKLTVDGYSWQLTLLLKCFTGTGIKCTNFFDLSNEN